VKSDITDPDQQSAPAASATDCCWHGGLSHHFQAFSWTTAQQRADRLRIRYRSGSNLGNLMLQGRLDIRSHADGRLQGAQAGVTSTRVGAADRFIRRDIPLGAYCAVLDLEAQSVAVFEDKLTGQVTPVLQDLIIRYCGRNGQHDAATAQVELDGVVTVVSLG
jgi:hypothetical protein